ncbi:GNAT family N-acetyltransferase [Microbacterium aquilitoris]|uniref:GNAT family N-acetyltransferase n=1 Tax=Microbacterium aquilitoris TaxID=3067307 RepID=UPI000E23C909|nr:GNAT family N-acetyltransferase [Microbacterium sp. KSW2-22]MDT3343923.1 GNAT family N-acetyltransferase [Microbacterium sp. KSW2-22]
MTDAAVRRIRLQEWREVRDLRIRAVSDPAASIAFLTTREQESARDDAHWQARTADAALGQNAAQFVAISGERWIGSVTVLVRDAGATDALGRGVAAPRAELVGVFVDPGHRGRGVLDALVAEASVWAETAGADGLTLDVHIDNARAQAAYRRLGFTATGLALDTEVGREIQMHRPSH